MPYLVTRLANQKVRVFVIRGFPLHDRCWHAVCDLMPAQFGLEEAKDRSIYCGYVNAGGGGSRSGVGVLGETNGERVQLCIIVTDLVPYVLNPIQGVDDPSLPGMDVPDGPVSFDEATGNIFLFGCRFGFLFGLHFGICFGWHN